MKRDNLTAFASAPASAEEAGKEDNDMSQGVDADAAPEAASLHSADKYRNCHHPQNVVRGKQSRARLVRVGADALAHAAAHTRTHRRRASLIALLSLSAMKKRREPSVRGQKGRVG